MEYQKHQKSSAKKKEGDETQKQLMTNIEEKDEGLNYSKFLPMSVNNFSGDEGAGSDYQTCNQNNS